MVRIELLPDFLQEAGEENCIGAIPPLRGSVMQLVQQYVKILRGCVCVCV